MERGSDSRRTGLLVGCVQIFSIAGAVLGICTLGVVFRVMSGFREELRASLIGVTDPERIAAFEHMVALEQRAMLGILAAMVLVAILSVAASLTVMTRRPTAARP